TDRYYVKKFEAETTITGYLAIDLSGSMAYTHDERPGALTKFDYCVSLAAALAYLMIGQQDPVGMVAFDQKIAHALPPKSKRTQLGTLLSLLAGLKPTGETDVAAGLTQLAAMLRHASLVMVFSDLLVDEEPVLRALRRLRHGGHDVILFHVLDEAEVTFPFRGLTDFEEPETGQRLELDADGYRADYREAVDRLRETYRRECSEAGVDYVPLDTGMPFDRALTEYLVQRRRRG
ncbi:MAG: VWA domain-containing protein, partial [Planctomycetota bacterium]